jgi:hypothetical protein
MGVRFYLFVGVCATEKKKRRERTFPLFYDFRPFQQMKMEKLSWFRKLRVVTEMNIRWYIYQCRYQNPRAPWPPEISSGGVRTPVGG